MEVISSDSAPIEDQIDTTKLQELVTNLICCQSCRVLSKQPDNLPSYSTMLSHGHIFVTPHPHLNVAIGSQCSVFRPNL